MTQDEEIDAGVDALIGVLKFASLFSAKLRLSLPVISIWLRYQAHKLKTGIASGAIVPDGAGGFVPASNSRFDPKTGKFID